MFGLEGESDDPEVTVLNLGLGTDYGVPEPGLYQTLPLDRCDSRPLTRAREHLGQALNRKRLGTSQAHGTAEYFDTRIL